MESSVIVDLSNHDSLMLRVKKALEDAIIRNELKPGEHLREADLSKRFGISRAPIREAFRVLESEGLVVNQPRKGLVVAPLNYKDAQDLYDVRPLLEGRATRLAVTNRDPEFLDSLEQVIRNMQIAVTNEDVVKFTLADAEFHRCINENSRNQVLIEMLQHIWRRCFRYLIVTNSHRGELKSAFTRHRKLLQVISEDTPANAQHFAEKNLLLARKLLLEDLKILGFE